MNRKREQKVDNFKIYWFRKKFFSWCRVPVRWQGWLVVIAGVALAFCGFTIGQIDDAPGAALLGLLLMSGLFFVFIKWKGEK